MVLTIFPSYSLTLLTLFSRYSVHPCRKRLYSPCVPAAFGLVYYHLHALPLVTISPGSPLESLLQMLFPFEDVVVSPHPRS